MSIEILVGLPHLADGPILDRVRQLRQPALVSANALSRWTMRDGVREWRGWRIAHLANARGLSSLALDSAGFVATAAYGGFPWGLGDYVALAASFPFRWWASADYCVEAEIARDRAEVLDRISRTIRANRDCLMLGRDAGIERTFLPVIQGRRPEDYERCAEALWGPISRQRRVGVGSMCRREIRGPEGIIAVVEHLDTVLPASTRLHLFGVKGDAIPYLLPYAHRIETLDSQAYGVSARREAHRRRTRKSDRFVADHLEAWLAAQNAKLRARPTRLPIAAAAPADVAPADPWEAAIAQAQAEIRALIETGDLDHSELTAPWLEQWAADIYRDRPEA